MQPSQEQAGELAVLFSGLAHPTRVRLVGLLLEEEHNVSELMRALDLPQARVSRHLQTLRHCGCCTARQKGSWVYYRARQPTLIAELLHLANTTLSSEADAGASHWRPD
jgi:DNA-binding transcriptional ArsR family regulator